MHEAAPLQEIKSPATSASLIALILIANRAQRGSFVSEYFKNRIMKNVKSC